MNENENSLSERFAEHAAAAYKRMGLSDEDYWLQQLGRWMFLDHDAILVALRTAERPDPRDAELAALRAERDTFMASNAGLTNDALALRAERDALAAKLEEAEEALTALSVDRGIVWGQSTEAEMLGWRNHTNALIEYARAALSRLTAEPASKGDEG